MPPPAQSFEDRIDRTGPHHLWLGAKKADGTGQVRINGKLVTAPRAAWERTHGAVPPGMVVRGCRDEPACVRLDHLQLSRGRGQPAPPTRSPRGGGSKRQIRPGVWKLSVSSGTYSDGTQRRSNRTIAARTGAAAARELAAFAAEIHANPLSANRDAVELTLDAALEVFLVQHLREEKGREDKTIDDYRRLHRRWFSPAIGSRRVRDIDQEHLDRIFGQMRKAGLSRSRLNQARSLYAPFFRWAKSRRMTNHDPMVGFQLPTSTHVSRERVPPEVEELSLLLREALDVVPQVAPVLALGAVTGMRRGELVAIRRSSVDWDQGRLVVDVAISETKQVKGTKTRRERSLFIDGETIRMLQRHCDQMDDRAVALGTTVPSDGFIFSLASDCAIPMPPDYVTKRVAALKEHLGIADKRPATLSLEDEALRLYRQTPPPRIGMTGPAPNGGMSFRRIGEELGRTERWAAMAVAAATRREAAATRGLSLNFDGSILALRKFTSSELLDAGFNISMVAQRQGHGPQVLLKHYAKGRRSSDRRAADHLGDVLYRAR